jgi:hypothetical protein
MSACRRGGIVSGWGKKSRPYRAWLSFVDEYPGLRPGLACFAPSGPRAAGAKQSFAGNKARFRMEFGNEEREKTRELVILSEAKDQFGCF